MTSPRCTMGDDALADDLGVVLDLCHRFRDEGAKVVEQLGEPSGHFSRELF